MKVYDTQFNGNEWAIIIGIILGLVLVWLLPSRFPRKLAILYFLCGMTAGSIFDLTLAAIPVSFYDVGDTSDLDVFGISSLLIYGSVSYVYCYLYSALKIRLKYASLYIFVWACLSVFMECLGTIIGVYHYDNGYSIQVSFEIYVGVHAAWLLFYYLTQRWYKPDAQGKVPHPMRRM